MKKPKKHEEPDFRALECVLCFRRYSQEEILSGLYQLDTMVCSPCYAAMQEADYVRSCFGKATYVLPNGKREWGYNPSAKECHDLCLDRKVCRRVLLHPPSIVSTSEEEHETET